MNRTCCNCLYGDWEWPLIPCHKCYCFDLWEAKSEAKPEARIEQFDPEPELSETTIIEEE